jgi:MOSC domain-containing protein YiiM
MSGFVKSAVKGPVRVTSMGLEGDEQADLRVHGGVDKAVYGYAISHYLGWSREFPEHRGLFVAGGVGENLPVEGLDEDTVCIGDQHSIGTAVLVVCQHRQPCYKFALRFDDIRVVRAMVKNGRCGWYYRVLREGSMQAGDEVRLLNRPNPGWTVARFAALQTRHGFDNDVWAQLAVLPGLADNWRAKARQQLHL